MIIARPTTDFQWVKAVMTHPKIWKWISDDGSVCPLAFQPCQSHGVTYLALYDDDRALGFYMLVPVNCATVEVHTCLLPSAWGDKSIECSKKATEWIWSNTHFDRIISSVPDSNRLALRYALKSGLSEYGVNQKSWRKNGKLEDIHLVGISRS